MARLATLKLQLSARVNFMWISFKFDFYIRIHLKTSITFVVVVMVVAVVQVVLVLVVDSFYEELGQVFDHFPKYHMKILLGDFNTKLGREVIFKPTIRNDSLHQDSNDNGVRVINIATSTSLVVKSTIFQWHITHINYIQISIKHPSVKVNSICRGKHWGSVGILTQQVNY
jgi:hypothetical protein